MRVSAYQRWTSSVVRLFSLRSAFGVRRSAVAPSSIERWALSVVRCFGPFDVRRWAFSVRRFLPLALSIVDAHAPTRPYAVTREAAFASFDVADFPKPAFT
jgi:hypothetical protein